MGAETEGFPDNMGGGGIIVLFKENDIILATSPGHEMLYLSLCAWRNDVMEFKSAVEKLHVFSFENNTTQAMFLCTGP